ncbi:MAG: class I SAM-dependent methyltransferase [Polyangiales bacterium]
MKYDRMPDDATLSSQDTAVVGLSRRPLYDAALAVAMLILAGNVVWADARGWVLARRGLLALLSLAVLIGLLRAVGELRRSRGPLQGPERAPSPVPWGAAIRLGGASAALVSAAAVGVSLWQASRFSLLFAALGATAVLVLAAAEWTERRRAAPDRQGLSEGSGTFGASLAALLLLLCVADLAMGLARDASPLHRLFALLTFAALFVVARSLEAALSHRRARIAAAELTLARLQQGMLSKGRRWSNADDAQRDGEWITREIVTQLDLARGMKVADVGAGAGYFARKLAEAVGPEGLVFATDADLWAAAKLRELQESEGLSQLRPMHVDHAMPLPISERVHRVLLVNVGLFSEQDEARGQELLRDFAAKISPGGLLVLYQQFVHEKGWRSGPDLPPLPASEPEGETVLRWASACFDLVARPALPAPAKPFDARERQGYLLVLRRR